MEEALHKGDYVLVNKLPVKGNPGRNRTVLFYSPLSRDSLHSPLLVGRCLGMPGDTLIVDTDGYILNNKRIPLAPQSLQTWLVSDRFKDICLTVLQTLHIPLREWTSIPPGYTLRLTPLEVAQINQEVSSDILQLVNPAQPYQIILPQKGRAYRLDEFSLPFCKEAILSETGGSARFKDNKLYLDGKETSFFFFGQDYYWLLSDNPEEAVDSRYLGIIPADHLVGNVWFCWYSNDKNKIFTKVN